VNLEEVLDIADFSEGIALKAEKDYPPPKKVCLF
jgi:hypothetical protein